MTSDVSRVGAAAAVGIGVVYLIVGINTLVNPIYVNDFDDMAIRLAEAPLGHYIRSFGFATISVLFIPVMSALAGALGHVRTALVQCATVIGYFGCAGTIMSTLRVLRLAPLRAQTYVMGDETVRAAIRYNWVGNSLDPDGWMQFGAVGTWLLVISLVALREGRLFPKGWAWLGVAASAIHFAILLSFLAIPEVEGVAALLGAFIFAPIWGFWTGLVLRRLSIEDGGAELSNVGIPKRAG